jgi:hypothetical protein
MNSQTALQTPFMYQSSLLLLSVVSAPDVFPLTAMSSVSKTRVAPPIKYKIASQHCRSIREYTPHHTPSFVSKDSDKERAKLARSKLTIYTVHRYDFMVRTMSSKDTNNKPYLESLVGSLDRHSPSLKVFLACAFRRHTYLVTLGPSLQMETIT